MKKLITFLMIAMAFFYCGPVSAQCNGLVTSPAEGVTWQLAQQYDITWPPAVLEDDMVTIVLVSSGGCGTTTHCTIASNIPNNGNYSWRISASCVSQDKSDYRITVIGEAGTTCAQGGNFTITTLGDTPPRFTREPFLVFPDGTESGTLSKISGSPTQIPDVAGMKITWEFVDPKPRACSNDGSYKFQYRKLPDGILTTKTPEHYLNWAWIENPKQAIGEGAGGNYELKVSVTDCAGYTADACCFYIHITEPEEPPVNQPPVITKPPFFYCNGTVVPISKDQNNPTIAPDGCPIAWEFSDDMLGGRVLTHNYFYWKLNDPDLHKGTPLTYLYYVWVENPKAVLGSGTFAFWVSVTDSMNATTTTLSSPCFFTIL